MPFDSPPCRPKPDVALEPWRKVLLDAADYIEAHGWRQNSYGLEPHGSTCMVGAIFRVGGTMSGALHRIDARCLPYASAWNDAPGRTAAEVCAALRACSRS